MHMYVNTAEGLTEWYVFKICINIVLEWPWRHQSAVQRSPKSHDRLVQKGQIVEEVQLHTHLSPRKSDCSIYNSLGMLFFRSSV